MPFRDVLNTPVLENFGEENLFIFILKYNDWWF